MKALVLTMAAVASCAAAAGAPAALGAQQQTHVLIVAGLGGDDSFSERFLAWGLELRTAAIDGYGLPPGNVVLLTEDPAMDPSVDSRSTRDNIAAAFEGIAGRASPGDRALIVLLGHGSFRDAEARFNLPGPDLGPDELGAMLDALPFERIAVVNAASASGPFVPALAAPGRTIIAATRTGQERNETRFGEFFAAAFGDEAADLDKNGGVSLLEAFQFAQAETARSYDEAGLLMTEHAVLDDDGDGEPATEPDVDGADGALAASFVLSVRGARAADATAGAEQGRAAPADSALARLYEERAALEEQVAALRRQRAAMDPEEYDRQLEELLLDLALKSREIREREGGAR